jgi:hypothetical protein
LAEINAFLRDVPARLLDRDAALAVQEGKQNSSDDSDFRAARIDVDGTLCLDATRTVVIQNSLMCTSLAAQRWRAGLLSQVPDINLS